MGLIDRLTNRRHFSDGTGISKLPSGSTSEIGVAGESIIGPFGEGEQRTDKLSIDDYIRMRQRDGTMASLYNILTLPVLSNTYQIVPDEKDTSEEQAAFVRGNLLEPPHRGGMELPMPLILADMLRAVTEGFRLYEKVWELRDGKLAYKKLAPRDARTVILKRDDVGGYGGAAQRSVIYQHEVKYDLEMPAWKTFLFTFGKDKNFLYGESAFKAAAYHYENKHKLYYLANLAVQVGAVPPKVVTGPAEGVGKDTKTSVLKQIDKLGVKTSAYMPTGFTLAPYDAAKGRVDPLPLIEHHNAEMARSVLAQFLMLGTTTGNVGSWALSSDHSDIFIIALRGLMQNIEHHLNFYVIPELIDVNFADANYPEFRFDDMTANTKELMKLAFEQLIRSGKVSEAMAKGLEDRIADTLEVDLDTINKELEKDRIENPSEIPEPGRQPQGAGQPEPISPKGGDPIAPVNQSDQKKKNLADTKWFRPLTPAERRVNFAAIETKMNQLEADFTTHIGELFTKIKDDAVMRLTKLLEANDLKALDSFALRYGSDYVSLIVTEMRDAYEFAKKGAADELGVAAPGTKRDTNTFITQQAQSVVDKQFSDLVFIIRSEVLKQLRKNTLAETNLGLSDILSSISDAFDSFFDDKISLTGGVVVAQAINRGRDDVFTASRDQIQVYQYSAILDGATCPICADLDGMTLDYAGYRDTKWVPPIHFNCRCAWVAILADDPNPPDITGPIDQPGGIAEPTL